MADVACRVVDPALDVAQWPGVEAAYGFAIEGDPLLPFLHDVSFVPRASSGCRGSPLTSVSAERRGETRALSWAWTTSSGAREELARHAGAGAEVGAGV